MEKKLNQILFCHPINFVYEIISQNLELNGVKVYGLDDLSDFSFLIEDLSPEIILIHESALTEENIKMFNSQCSGRPNLVRILISKENNSIYSENFHHVLSGLIDPSELVGILSSLLES